jgi:hypothetical protein
MAAPQLHEDLTREDEVVGSSDRAFGLTFAVIFSIVGSIQLWYGLRSGWAWLTGAAAVALLAVCWPRALALANRAWLKIALLLYKVVNPLVLALIFFTTVTPIGLLLRAFGKDPLRLRRSPAAPSYWIARESSDARPDSMKQQF